MLLVPLVGLAPLAAQASISNGANAVDLLGQYDETSQTAPQPVYTKSGANNGPNRLGVNSPRALGIDTTNDYFFVADTSNHRVLVYSLASDNTFPDRIPEYVLGQPNFYTATSGASQTAIANPQGLAVDMSTSRLFVSCSNNRLVVYDYASGFSNGMNAAYVLGQSTFTGVSGATTQTGLNSPTGLEYDAANARLFVSDQGNNRVLVFSGASIATGMNAAKVIGQANFTSSTGTASQTRLNAPSDVAYDPATNRIFVAERNNNRVTVFTGSVLANGMAAAKVIGQANFTASSIATTQTGMNDPTGVAYDSTAGRLFVNTRQSSRILVFTGSTITDGMNAAKVLGQSTFTTSTAAVSQTGLSLAWDSLFDSTNSRLYVVDTNANRLVAYSTTTLVNGQAAVDALGQYDETSLTDPQPSYKKSGVHNSPNRLGFNTDSSYYGPQSIALDSTNHRLFVSDMGNRRILVYALSSTNTLTDRIPDYVIGQTDFGSGSSAANAVTPQNPEGILYDAANDRLFVADAGRNRVLVYDTSSISNGMAASYVLGQSSFTASTSGTTQAKVSYPAGLAYDGSRNRLFVSDLSNNRVLVYTFTGGVITNGMSGSNVLGQSNFTSSSSSTTQARLSTPAGISFDSVNNRLYVSENSNNRILVFDLSSGLGNGMNARYVLGQPDFISPTSDVTQSGMDGPLGLSYDSVGKRLFVGDANNHRVLVYNVASITNGEPAQYVLGQSTFLTFDSATTQSGLSFPSASVFDAINNRLYQRDINSNRIVVFDVAPAISVSISGSIGANVNVSVTDSTRDTTTSADTLQITLDVQSGDRETVTLTETATGSGIFNGSISLIHGSQVRGDGILSNNEASSFTIAASYTDLYSTVHTATSGVITDGGGTAISGGGGGGGRRNGRSSPPLEGGRTIDPANFQPSVDGYGVTGNAGNALVRPSAFLDVPPASWFASAVAALKDLGIISGYARADGTPTNTFGPADPVTRAQILKMALLAAKKEISDGAPANPSAANSWAAPFVRTAQNLRLSLFTPAYDVHAPATRGEVVQILMEVFNLPPQSTVPDFSDVPATHRFALAIAQAQALGIVEGDRDTAGKLLGTFRPDAAVNRAEAAVILQRLLEQRQEENS